MQRLTYFVATSIDGNIARPDDSFDFFVGEGDHVTDYLAALKTFDSVVMGRRTYDIAAKAGVTNPYPWLTSSRRRSRRARIRTSRSSATTP